MKDQIHNLVVTNSISYFIPQGTGVKVLNEIMNTCFSLNGVGRV